MKPNENYLAGALVIVTGFMVLYYYNKKRKAEKNNRHFYILAIAIVELVTGCLGICLNTLCGINSLLYGITMFWHMRNSQAPNSGVLITMYNKGWWSAIGAIILGILIILDELNIFSLWREI